MIHLSKKDYIKSKPSPLEYLIDNYQLGWDYSYIVSNPNIYYEFIIKHINDFQDSNVYCNPNLSWEQIQKLHNTYNFPLDMFEISKHKAVTWSSIQSHPQYDWDMQAWSLNPNCNDLTLIRNHLHTNWGKFAFNRYAPIEELVTSNLILWNSIHLAINPNLTWNHIKQYLNKPWDWYTLSLKKDIEFNIVKNYREIDGLDWFWVSCNPGITWDIVKNNPEQPWDIDSLCMNPNITIQHLLDSDYKNKLDWFYLSKHTPLDYIEEHPQLPWDFKGLSANPYLTTNFFHTHIDKAWKTNYLSSNLFLYDDNAYKRSRRIHARKQAIFTTLLKHPSLYPDLSKTIINYIGTP